MDKKLTVIPDDQAIGRNIMDGLVDGGNGPASIESNEVGLDVPDLPLTEAVEMMRLDPALSFCTAVQKGGWT